MVRHECGEALGAISSTSSIPILQTAIAQNPKLPEISETCSLAISFINWKLQGGIEGDVDQPMVCACMLNPYSSIDPAPPHPKHASLSTHDIGQILHAASNPLFERYRAMFSLRNRGTKECVQELGHALIHDDSSALLRHEIAYVLGQMQSPDSIHDLRTSLERCNEHVMVRHESAEALGAIEENWDEVEMVLKSFMEDDDVVVRESCIVALDAADYWGRNISADNSNDIDIIISNENDRDVVTGDVSFAQQKAQPAHS
jgi:deoxyhypusine monooxygenase